MKSFLLSYKIGRLLKISAFCFFLVYGKNCFGQEITTIWETKICQKVKYEHFSTKKGIPLAAAMASNDIYLAYSRDSLTTSIHDNYFTKINSDGNIVWKVKLDEDRELFNSKIIVTEKGVLFTANKGEWSSYKYSVAYFFSHEGEILKVSRFQKPIWQTTLLEEGVILVFATELYYSEKQSLEIRQFSHSFSPLDSIKILNPEHSILGFKINNDRSFVIAAMPRDSINIHYYDNLWQYQGKNIIPKGNDVFYYYHINVDSWKNSLLLIGKFSSKIHKTKASAIVYKGNKIYSTNTTKWQGSQFFTKYIEGTRPYIIIQNFILSEAEPQWLMSNNEVLTISESAKFKSIYKTPLMQQRHRTRLIENNGKLYLLTLEQDAVQEGEMPERYYCLVILKQNGRQLFKTKISTNLIAPFDIFVSAPDEIILIYTTFDTFVVKKMRLDMK